MTLSLRRQESAAWEIAGMVSVERGLVATSGIPLSSRVRPQQAWIADGYLGWAGFQDDGFQPFDSTGMLDAFVRIGDPEAIPPFAVRFGTLQLCAHRLPISHAQKFEALWRWEAETTWGPSRDCLPTRKWISEPVDRWMLYVAGARAILNIAAAIHSGSPGRYEDWLAGYDTFDPDEDFRPKPDIWDRPLHHGLQEPAIMLSDLVNQWLRLGNVRPRLEWELGEPRIEFDTSTFGAIGVQLMEAVTRVHGLTLCSSCGKPYLRQGRKAPAGRRNYCPDCGSGAALRDAQRAHRERRRKSDGQTES